MGITLRRLVLLVVLMVGLASCADKTNGSPLPGTPNEPSTGTPPSTGTTKPGGSPLADTDPCSLLSASDQSTLGVGNGEKRTVGVARTCRWRLRGANETIIFDVGILEAAGITDVPSSIQVKQLPDIGGHKAAEHTGGGGAGSCTIILGVSQKSRVDTNVIAGTDTQKACDRTMELARLVEPNLP